MTFIKINEKLYPAVINGKFSDNAWDNRESKAITLEMDYTEASEIFVDGLAWSIVEQNETETGIEETEWDNSEFNLAGDLTDHRDGTITAKMGKLTDLEEAYEIMFGGM